jgi:hypothetical protein
MNNLEGCYLVTYNQKANADYARNVMGATGLVGTCASK